MKVDASISASIRGRYARICIQSNLVVSVKTVFTIGGGKQRIIYKGEGVICKSCGHLGHTALSYQTIKGFVIYKASADSNTISTSPTERDGDEWQTIFFAREKRPPRMSDHWVTSSQDHRGKKQEATPGKFLKPFPLRLHRSAYSATTGEKKLGQPSLVGPYQTQYPIGPKVDQRG